MHSLGSPGVSPVSPNATLKEASPGQSYMSRPIRGFGLFDAKTTPRSRCQAPRQVLSWLKPAPLPSGRGTAPYSGGEHAENSAEHAAVNRH